MGATGLSKAARRYLSALVAVAFVLQPFTALAARELKQQASNPISTNLLGGVFNVTQLIGNIGTIGITSQTLAGAVTIDFNPLTLPLASPSLIPPTPTTGPFLYVWNAYGASYTDPLVSLTNTDFLAVIDLNTASPTYKKIIHVERLPTIGNEPHHISVSRDRTRIVAGGLLSFLRLQDDIYSFDIASDPRRPRLLKSTQLVKTAVTDHVFGLKNGNFLLTQMGSKVGGAPGGISIFDKNLNLISTYPADGNTPPDLNPHGADAISDKNLLVTSDFVNPVTTVTAQVFSLPVATLLNQTAEVHDLVSSESAIVTRNTVRVWDLSDLSSIKNTIILPGAQGVIDIKIIPGANNTQSLAYATGVFNGGLYLVNPTTGDAKEVLNFGIDAHPHLLAPANQQGDRFFLTLNKAGAFLLLDTSVPDQPKVLDSIYFGAGSAPHYITPVAPGDNRVAVTDYFLDQGAIGKVHAPGLKKVYVIPFTRNSLNANATLAFNFGSINGRPHAVATNYQYTDVEA